MAKRNTKALTKVLIGAVVLVVAAGAAVMARRAYVASSIAQAYKQGQEHFAKAEHAKALPLLARYVGRNQGDVDALLMLAECRAMVPKSEGNELVDAARYGEAVLARDSRNERAMTLLIGWYGRLGFLTELNRTADALLAANPSNRLGLTTKAQTAMALGDYDKATELASKLAELDPTSADPHRLTLEARRRRGGTPRDVAQEAGRIAEKYPANFEIAVIHAQTLIGAQETVKAAEAVYRAASIPPSSLRGLGDLLRVSDALAAISRVAGPSAGLPQADELQQAVRVTLEAAAKNPALAPGALPLAVGWEWRGGRIDRAEQWLAQADAANASSIGTHGWRALLARDQNKPWDQHAAAVRAAPGATSSPWLALIEVFDAASRDDWRAAMERCEALITRCDQDLAFSGTSDTPEDQLRRAEAQEITALAEHQCGVIAQQLGEWRVAVRHWTAASEAEPFWSLPLTSAAQALLDRGQLDAASDAASRAVRIRPGVFEALVAARTTVRRDEQGGTPAPGTLDSITLLNELVTQPLVRAEALTLRARAHLVRGNLEAARRDIKDAQGLTPPADPGNLLSLAGAMRVANETGWEAIQQAALSAMGPTQQARIRAAEEFAAGRAEQALDVVRKAAANAEARDVVGLRIQEAQILSARGEQPEARRVLSDLSAAMPTDASVQLQVLEQSAIWTEAAAVDKVIDRLRSSSGPNAVEWKLAAATRALTFSPEPAKAQENILQLNGIVRADPANVQALALIAEWMVVLDDTNAAVDNLTRAVAVPDAPAALHARLVGLLRTAGRNEDARAQLRSFAALSSLSDGERRARAELLAEFQMIDEATADWRVLATSGAPDDVIAYARILSARKPDPRSAQMLEGLLTTPDLGDDQSVTAAIALVDVGKPDRAIELFEARQTRKTPAWKYVRLAAILERAERFDEAARQLALAVEADPSPANVLEHSRFYTRRGDAASARRVIAQARQRGVTSAELDSADALAASLTGEMTPEQQQAVIQSIPEGAERDLAEATRWFDASPNDKQGFIDRLRKITAKDPRLPLAWQFLVENLAETGQIEDAIKAARSASAANPSSAPVARMEATLLLMAGRPAEAEPAALRWSQLAPDSPEARNSLARVFVLTNRAQDAKPILDELARTHEANPAALPRELWASIVASYARIGDTTRARALAAKLPAGDPAWIATQVQIAAGEASPVDAAREWLDDLRAAAPADRSLSTALAEGYASLAERSRSDEDLQKAFDLVSSRLSASDVAVGEQLMGASLLERLRRDSEAEAIYRAVIAREPKQWLALNNLAYLLLARDPKAQEPMGLTERALAASSENRIAGSVASQLHQTRAIAQLAAGKPTDALETARNALRLDSDSGPAALIEARALEATGDRARALDAVRVLLGRIEAGRARLSPAEMEQMQSLAARLESARSPTAP